MSYLPIYRVVKSSIEENGHQASSNKYSLDKDDAEKLLDSDEIIGYLLIDTEPNIKIIMKHPPSFRIGYSLRKIHTLSLE